jgi:hypothetical protein
MRCMCVDIDRYMYIYTYTIYYCCAVSRAAQCGQLSILTYPRLGHSCTIAVVTARARFLTAIIIEYVLWGRCVLVSS